MFEMLLFLANLIFLALATVFTYESYREQEPRAPKFGLAGIVLHLLVALFILSIPSSRIYISIYFGLLIFTGLIFLIPTRSNPQALLGTKGIIVGDISRFDERDEVFARNETLHPDRKEYQLYYEAHPELKERDDRRRAVGGDLGNPGSIDNGHRPNVGMLFSTFEMDNEMVRAAPHTPTVVESSRNYAKESYITTTLARWFANMGYHGSAQMVMHYDALMVPLAVDAGLGQLGRQGYLVADKYGTRIRLGAVLTDMPLVPDKPIDLGVEEFCKACLKCAESCPSHSIPLGKKSVVNGSQRWKLKEESCHDYWGKAGTDCAVCMAICPYGRPNRTIHKLVKWILKRSRLARLVFPHIDNMVYGRKWKPRSVPNWINYRLSS